MLRTASHSLTPKTAKPIGAKTLSPPSMTTKYLDRRRVGKTAKDRAGGYAKRNAERKALRAEWQKDNRATNATFPV